MSTSTDTSSTSSIVEPVSETIIGDIERKYYKKRKYLAVVIVVLVVIISMLVVCIGILIILLGTICPNKQKQL